MQLLTKLPACDKRDQNGSGFTCLGCHPKLNTKQHNTQDLPSPVCPCLRCLSAQAALQGWRPKRRRGHSRAPGIPSAPRDFSSRPFASRPLQSHVTKCSHDSLHGLDAHKSLSGSEGFKKGHSELCPLRNSRIPVTRPFDGRNLPPRRWPTYHLSWLFPHLPRLRDHPV